MIIKEEVQRLADQSVAREEQNERTTISYAFHDRFEIKVPSSEWQIQGTYAWTTTDSGKYVVGRLTGAFMRYEDWYCLPPQEFNVLKPRRKLSWRKYHVYNIRQLSRII